MFIRIRLIEIHSNLYSDMDKFKPKTLISFVEWSNQLHAHTASHRRITPRFDIGAVDDDGGTGYHGPE